MRGNLCQVYKQIHPDSRKEQAASLFATLCLLLETKVEDHKAHMHIYSISLTPTDYIKLNETR